MVVFCSENGNKSLYIIGHLVLRQGSLCSFFTATAAATAAAAAVFPILRLLGFLWTFTVPSKCLQLSLNLYYFTFPLNKLNLLTLPPPTT